MNKKTQKPNQPKKKKIRYCNVIDLFAGAGGLSLGFEQVKGEVRFKIRVAFENNPNMQETYKKNPRICFIFSFILSLQTYVKLRLAKCKPQ